MIIRLLTLCGCSKRITVADTTGPEVFVPLDMPIEPNATLTSAKVFARRFRRAAHNDDGLPGFEGVPTYLEVINRQEAN